MSIRGHTFEDLTVNWMRVCEFHHSNPKSIFTWETLVKATHVTNTDFAYALIRVFTCETQVAITAVSGETSKLRGIALSVVDKGVSDFL